MTDPTPAERLAPYKARHMMGEGDRSVALATIRMNALTLGRKDGHLATSSLYWNRHLQDKNPLKKTIYHESKNFDFGNYPRIPISPHVIGHRMDAYFDAQFTIELYEPYGKDSERLVTSEVVTTKQMMAGTGLSAETLKKTFMDGYMAGFEEGVAPRGSRSSPGGDPDAQEGD